MGVAIGLAVGSGGARRAGGAGAAGCRRGNRPHVTLPRQRWCPHGESNIGTNTEGLDWFGLAVHDKHISILTGRQGKEYIFQV
jgi:hypothetical protein